jgi:hypothetical protein
MAGTLSTKNSTTDNSINRPITHQFSKVFHGGVNVIRLVNFAKHATIRRGIYAFNPALAERPKAENISMRRSP